MGQEGKYSKYRRLVLQQTTLNHTLQNVNIISSLFIYLSALWGCGGVLTMKDLVYLHEVNCLYNS